MTKKFLLFEEEKKEILLQYYKNNKEKFFLNEGDNLDPSQIEKVKSLRLEAIQILQKLSQLVSKQEDKKTINESITLLNSIDASQVCLEENQTKIVAGKNQIITTKNNLNAIQRQFVGSDLDRLVQIMDELLSICKNLSSNNNSIDNNSNNNNNSIDNNYNNNNNSNNNQNVNYSDLLNKLSEEQKNYIEGWEKIKKEFKQLQSEGKNPQAVQLGHNNMCPPQILNDILLNFPKARTGSLPNYKLKEDNIYGKGTKKVHEVCMVEEQRISSEIKKIFSNNNNSNNNLSISSPDKNISQEDFMKWTMD